MSKYPPTLSIQPVERRQALQARVGREVPRYARTPEKQRPYQTHHALECIERAVSEGLLPAAFLDSDERVFGAIVARAELRDAQESGVATSINLSSLAHEGYLAWLEISRMSALKRIDATLSQKSEQEKA